MWSDTPVLPVLSGAEVSEAEVAVFDRANVFVWTTEKSLVFQQGMEMSMMQQQTRLTRKLGTVFEQRQVVMLAEVITDACNELVKTSDFNELKSIVKELAQAQKELTEA